MSIFDAASILSDRVHTEVLPDDTSRPEVVYTPGWNDPEQRAKYDAYHDWKPSAEASAYEHIIKEASEVQVGDLVLVVNNTKRRGEWGWNPVTATDTIAGVAERNRFYVVTGTTSKRVSLAHVSIPTANWADSIDAYTVNEYPETFAAWAEPRRIIKTGLTLEEFKSRVTEHPDYARYAANFTAALAKRTEIEQRQAAEWKAEREAAEPIEAAAKQVRDALGVERGIVDTAGYPSKSVSISLKYVSHEETRRLLVLALRGRLALGEITKEEHDAAVATIVSAGRG